MNLNTWLWIGAVIVVIFLVKSMGQASSKTALEWLDNGAHVIDVRSSNEFQERHLPGVINIPLDRLQDEIGRTVTNKEQKILLHCLSGGRSGMAKGVLKRMGYSNVMNLGSYGRAERILNAKNASQKVH